MFFPDHDRSAVLFDMPEINAPFSALVILQCFRCPVTAWILGIIVYLVFCKNKLLGIQNPANPVELNLTDAVPVKEHFQQNS
ncbi:MAG: hypothetical protein Ct9H300mP28_29060 [Pseudomonadota bacterium]|nr:MAG: hypothetical protein Ct9H300mP28_29060 [Pseudomonadota bacterium]